jgi:ribosome-associated translation inhibitor RaiA
MIPTIQTTFKDLARSEAVDALVREEAGKLERFFDRIVSCRVFIEKVTHRREGAQYHVRIRLGVPGREIAVSSAPTEHAQMMAGEAERAHKSDEFDEVHRYVQPAVQDAFRKAGRQLQDYARRIAGDVKHHEEPLST